MRDLVADSYSNRDRDTYTHTNTNTDGNSNGYVYSDAETYAESTAASHRGASAIAAVAARFDLN